MNTDFLCEKVLKEKNLELHRRYKESALAVKGILENYRRLFPNYTDHTVLHSISVQNYCNALIGEEYIDELTAEELYTLLMACYLHDSGMGISDRDFSLFYEELEGHAAPPMSTEEIMDWVRINHHTLSACFIKKYSALFDFPDEKIMNAVLLTSIGHRKTDLFDEELYPADYTAGNGNRICLPYLAALIRIADEIDVASDRNIDFMYDIADITNEISVREFEKHKAVRSVEIEGDSIGIYISGDADDDILEGCRTLAGKIQSTLDYSRKVIDTRTPFSLAQNKVTIVEE